MDKCTCGKLPRCDSDQLILRKRALPNVDLPYSEAVSFCASILRIALDEQGFNMYNANKPKMSRAAAALRASNHF
eukprot:scaffold37768_cov137-Skeletonema_marinoi.AAC.4